MNTADLVDDNLKLYQMTMIYSMEVLFISQSWFAFSINRTQNGEYLFFTQIPIFCIRSMVICIYSRVATVVEIRDGISVKATRGGGP